MANELRNKLAIVGVTGAVFVGGVFGLSSLASATTTDQSDSSTPESSVAVEGDEHKVSDFDGFSTEDQDLILKFETCIDEGLTQLPEDGEEWTEENDQQVDSLFEECEVILDDLSFPAVEWLEGDDDWEELDGELSAEDEAVLEEFDTCIGPVEAELPEDEADWTDENFEQLESQFDACDSILDDLSEDAGFFIMDGDDFEGCEDLFEAEEGYDHDEDAEAVELTPAATVNA